MRGFRWATAAGALGLLVVLGAILFGSGALSAGAVDLAAEGPFELEIRSVKSQYTAGEPIDIAATLTYHGPEASVTIDHGHLSPVGFGIVEPVNGIQLSPAWRTSCETTILARDVGLTRAFAKSGASSGSDPSFLAFMQDPVLRLPAGTWHVYADASFSEGGCGSQTHNIRAEITINVTGA